jgi:ATP-dependent RNA helicase DeaD
MLDMGFADDLEAILDSTPEGKQTALFAATFAKRLQSIATKHLKDPARVTIAAEKTAAGKLPKIRQTARDRMTSVGRTPAECGENIGLSLDPAASKHQGVTS